MNLKLLLFGKKRSIAIAISKKDIILWIYSYKEFLITIAIPILALYFCILSVVVLDIKT